MLGRIATVSAHVEAERKERKALLLDAGKWLDGGYNPVTENCTAIINAGKRKIIAWNAAKAEVARKAAEAAAEQRRKEAAEAARVEAEALANAQAAIAEAAEARAAGSEQVADAMEVQAMVAVDTARQNAANAALAIHTAPVRITAAPAVKGGSTTWKGECTDLGALIVFVGSQIEAGNRSNIGLLEACATAINAKAKIEKQHLSVPGLRSYPDERLALKKQVVSA
jgi:hypothetical protein